MAVPKRTTTARDRVREYIRSRHTTQRALAAELGISEAHLSAVLSGHDSPSLDLAVRLEDITGIPAREFAAVA